MLVLSVDATSGRQSVAVVDAGVVLGEVRLASRAAHSRRLMPAIDFLLAQLDVAPRRIEGYAVTVGPGSFTGLRVGLSTVQGMALAAGCPVVGLSALDVLAARAAGERPGAPIVALVDSERGEMYAGFYDASGQPTSPAASLALPALLERLPDAPVLVGEGASVHADALRAARPAATHSHRSSFLAATAGLMAEPLLGRGLGIHPRELRPLYLRGAHLFGQPPA
jgi:tRNA threonylcarbamoyladenosine biosynthesis protein TsaB